MVEPENRLRDFSKNRDLKSASLMLSKKMTLVFIFEASGCLSKYLKLGLVRFFGSKQGGRHRAILGHAFWKTQRF